MNNVFRWLLVPLACVLAWYAAFIIGMLVHNLATRLCPAEQIVSGLCVADWFPLAEAIIICFGTALAAFLVIFTAAFSAPSHRIKVAWSAFFLGSVVAIYMAVATSLWAALVSALASGLVTVLLVKAMLPPMPPNNSLKRDAHSVGAP